MSTIYEGNDWKWAADTEDATERQEPSRAEKQARINTLYGTGRMSLQEWREKTDELSEPQSR